MKNTAARWQDALQGALGIANGRSSDIDLSIWYCSWTKSGEADSLSPMNYLFFFRPSLISPELNGRLMNWLYLPYDFISFCWALRVNIFPRHLWRWTFLQRIPVPPSSVVPRPSQQRPSCSGRKFVEAQEFSPKKNHLSCQNGDFFVFFFQPRQSEEVELKNASRIPSRELTYLPKMAFWRWCSFSQGGIC